MHDELQQIAQRLEQASTAEEVFGELPGPVDERIASLKRSYHHLAKIVHPDLYRGKAEQDLAQVSFQRLTAWVADAEARIRAGVYGRPSRAGSVLLTKKRAYFLDGSYEEDGVYRRYPCALEDNGYPTRAVLKIVRDERDNDLAANEAQVVRALTRGKAAPKFSPYLPRLIDSFHYEEAGVARRANVFEQPAGWYSLSAVREAYPAGVDPKDMSWMWRRLLVALGFAHLNGVIHGAVLPMNVLIQPEEHGLMLVEWSFALTESRLPAAYIAAMDLAYEPWYPSEVAQKAAPMPGTDIYMAAQCMIDLLGGDPIRHTTPAAVPTAIRMFLRACTLPDQKARPQDAWALKEEYDELLQRLWGERKFHPFSMKPNSSTVIGG